MAIARCEKCGKPTGAKVKPPGYVNQPYLPMGHPSSGVICGKPNCENDALIWLKIDEALAWRPELMAVVLSLFVAIVVLALDGAFNIVCLVIPWRKRRRISLGDTSLLEVAESRWNVGPLNYSGLGMDLADVRRWACTLSWSESLAPVLVVPCGYGGLHGNVGDF